VQRDASRDFEGHSRRNVFHENRQHLLRKPSICENNLFFMIIINVTLKQTVLFPGEAEQTLFWHGLQRDLKNITASGSYPLYSISLETLDTQTESCDLSKE
jgi:hypothetical protein